jgi:hypothetical protein
MVSKKIEVVFFSQHLNAIKRLNFPFQTDTLGSVTRDASLGSDFR